jgi:hypothetical protein
LPALDQDFPVWEASLATKVKPEVLAYMRQRQYRLKKTVEF